MYEQSTTGGAEPTGPCLMCGWQTWAGITHQCPMGPMIPVAAALQDWPSVMLLVYPSITLIAVEHSV